MQSSINSYRSAPFDGFLAAEREDVGATGASTLPGEQWGAVVLRSRADVATAGADLGLGGGQTCCSEACKEESVKGEQHLGGGSGGSDTRGGFELRVC